MTTRKIIGVEEMEILPQEFCQSSNALHKTGATIKSSSADLQWELE